ncbi:MAG: SusC/RagA family TonB-linked outer membrane protein [Paludibacter sp.]|nr:SusC/RagA family TonB-linked outer membrane protein [Paludibacter sp.]
MRKLTFLLACLFLVGVGLVNAQTKSISGKVFSADDGQPVIGATVMVKGTSQGTITDTDGNFKIILKGNDKNLIISYVGMKKVDVEAKDNMVVKLESDTRQMDEVVVVATALGIKRQEREVGYAATTIKDNFINQANSTNVDQALNGKISGLNVTTTNSGVFENAKLNIRGIRSLTGNNQPMFVLDGSPVDLSYLNSIAPSDIQDVTVLKSAASAALYGPDAVNGVILVTTKRGDTDKTAISITSSLEATKVSYFPQMQNQFGAGAGEVKDQFGNYGYVPYENQIYGARFDGSIQPIGIVNAQGQQQTGPYTNAHYSDKINFFNTGSTFQNAISLSSKDYFFSVTNADIRGIMPSDKNNRTTLRFSSGKDYGKLSVKYNINYTNQTYDVVNEADMPNLTTSSYTGSILSNVMQVSSNVPLLSYKNINSGWGQFDNYFNEFAFSPYWLIASLRHKGTTHDIIGNVDLEYKFAKWLKADVKASSNVSVENFANTDGPISVSDYTLNVLKRNSTQYHNQPGSVLTDMNLTSRVNVDAFLSGEFDVNQFNLKYVAGTTVRSNDFKDVSVGGNNLTVPGLYNVSVRSGDAIVNTYGATTSYAWNATIQSRLVSAYGNLTIGYKNLAFLDLTGRNDWDSRLAVANRSVFYPGASASVIMSDIFPSLKDNSISYLKLRAALNKSGNVNINPYSLQAVYTTNYGFPYGNTVGLTAGNTIPSPNLKPEFVTTTEAGFELRLLEDRVNVEATYFNQDCTNQILAVSQSWATGYPTALANAASFRNWGYEMDLSLTPLVKIGNGDFNFRINATYNDNVVTATQGNVPVVLTGNGNFIQNAASNPTVNNIAIVGQPAFAFQMTDYNRDPKTGKVIVDATTGNPSVSSTLVTKGRTLPLWVIGLSPSYTIGNFSVSMTWDYKGGNYFYAGIGPDMDFSGISARSAEYGRQRFVFPNSVYQSGTDSKGNPIYSPNTKILISDGNYGFWTGSTTNTGVATNYYASAAAWRLRELNITYNLPSKFLKNNVNFIKRASVSIIGKNLLMYLPKSNQWGDPEFNYTSSGNVAGVSSAYQTPASRFYGATVNVQF